MFCVELQCNVGHINRAITCTWSALIYHSYFSHLTSAPVLAALELCQGCSWACKVCLQKWLFIALAHILVVSCLIPQFCVNICRQKALFSSYRNGHFGGSAPTQWTCCSAGYGPVYTNIAVHSKLHCPHFKLLGSVTVSRPMLYRSSLDLQHVVNLYCWRGSHVTSPSWPYDPLISQ